ncbi:hypothetical protein GXM_04195 [Nostoc sphaeroides CCNUC1]|uniref:Uncharacterized protein n=1 Tax=Nostoc sphaeroides CCNUC1 TaxID=2653204 RepID=A0A5P8W283_9NOSO|nr:hypothetical protein GXM_04195 [Nostoc sphaeroides CCNUC1]
MKRQRSRGEKLQGQNKWGDEGKHGKITLCLFWSISKIYMVAEIP